MKLFKNLRAVTVLAFTLASPLNMAQAMSVTPPKFMFIDAGALHAQKIAEAPWRDSNSLSLLPTCDGNHPHPYRFVGTWGELGRRPKPIQPEKPSNTSLIDPELEIPVFNS